MKKRKLAALGLLLIDLGGFVMTVAFLPRRGSWGHSGPISFFINSRDRWDIAFAVLVALLLVSAGVFALFECRGVFSKTMKSEELSCDS
jgi:hypothetical protein